jgi:sugar lactone lactonase YvrE
MRWRNAKLYFSDMADDRVVKVADDGTVVTVAEIARPSGIGWLPDGALAVVSMTERTLHVLGADGAVDVIDLRPTASSSPNDMVISDSGVAYIGLVGVDIAQAPRLDAGASIDVVLGRTHRPKAPLLKVHDGKVTVEVDNMACANGAVITPSGRTCIVAETNASRLAQFDIEPDHSLTNQRTFADLGDHLPDGICLDADGGVWAALVDANRFVRVVDGGTVTDVVHVPEFAMACTLGGPDGRTLFMATSSVMGVAGARAARSGMIRSIEVTHPGPGIG